ncbi:hypothetical protein RHSIM_Rhsim02G0171400 [Rhododendron simsii]|uniref:Glycosyltransferase family 92 protein n=1 Tax=Rhododendron simsii TaxID=118357 RepID=A0A834LTF0_RHOSS|nr:hypothetical protein RHSIM_Rhsim02G0171400 [Rhododendron simsii]
MAKEREKEKKMFVGVSWNCAAELKFLITALLFVCSLVTVLQFLPPRFSLSSPDLRACIPDISTTAAVSNSTAAFSNSTAASNSSKTTADAAAVNLSPPPLPPPTTPSWPPPRQQDEVLQGGIIKRSFNTYGAASYNFVLMSAYRGGLNTFAVMGLSSKPLHVYGNPSYQCRWVPHNSTVPTSTAAGYKILPDWGYGRVYTVVVVNCTFPSPVGLDDLGGGTLLLLASTNGGGDGSSNTTDTIPALTEKPRTLNPNYFTSPPKYDYLYCGSCLYGGLSPQRIREWLAYHIRLFGERSHFVIHDAGGLHGEVMEVLKPWMEKGYVTVQDIKEQERFDGYYHNQFLIVNDCLHRYRFDAKWMFFFDVDEFVFVPRRNNIKAVMDSFSGYTQFTIEQMTMSNKLCLSDDVGVAHKKWGFEKLVYKDVKRGIRRDRKYAVQPRNVYATGVHMSQNVAGKTTHKTEGRIKYFHYHGTIADRREPCREFVNTTYLTSEDGIPYVQDTTMRRAAGNVKKFELRMIGPRLKGTRQ